MATISRVPKLSAGRMAEDGSFYAGMGVFCLAFSIAAFCPSIANPARRLGPITPLLALHSVALTAWLVLFIGQAVLARTRNLVLHRRLGVASIMLAATLVVLGFQVTIAMGRRGYDMAGDLVGARSDSLAAMAFPLLDLFLFASLFFAAFLYRHRSAIHKRLMLLVLTGALMPAPIAHFTGHYALFRDKGLLTPLIIAAFLAAAPIHDRLRTQRIHPVFLWLPPAIFVLEVTWAAVVVRSALWHALAFWLVN